ncbi:MAG: hypothetical protein ACRDNS_09085 [Trebonia sp.]
MTTAERFDAGFRAWSPTTAAGDQVYVGKHRKPGGRALSILRMFHRPKHRAR